VGVSKTMKDGFSTNLAVRVKRYSWPAVLIGIVITRAVISIAADPDSPLVAYGGISYLFLLLLALIFVVRNGIQNTLGNRPFWVLLAIGYGLWALDQAIILYHQVVLGTDVPDNSMADPVLFLHIAALMAAVATLPNLYPSGPKRYRVLSNSLLLIFFWGFLYVYAVFPYQYLFSNTTTYALRFDILYLIENLVLVAAVGILSLRAQSPWKAIYLHLLGASVLYALSSAVANTAIDSGGYVNGRPYGLGLTAAVCWFVWIPLRARRLTGTEIRTARFVTGEGSRASVWAMLVVLMLSVPMVWELFQRDQTAGVRRFRLLVAILAIVCLASIAYIKEHFAKGELISQLALSNDRLRLAVEAGKSVGWEWDLKSGRHSWFGGLHDMLGIESDTFIGRTEDFYSYVYPQDRQMVKKAVDDSTQHKKPYAAEFRILRRDGAVRWVTASGKPYYTSNGDPQRLLGIALDITERKLTEEALHESEDRVRLILDSTAEAIYGTDLEGRCTFCNPACLHALGYKSVDQLIGKDMHDLIHHSRADGTPFPAQKCRIFRATRTGEGVHVDDEVLWQANGANFPAEYWCHPQWKGAEVVGAVVAFFDITQRKLAQAALASVSGKLIEAQEQERSRIARELHDDIGQRLAVLSIELAFLQQSPPPLSELSGSLAKLQKQTSEIAADVQTLSHGLHSSKLQYLGIAAALRGFCQEFSGQQNVEVDFEAHDLPIPLAPDISLCLFRVLQEALHNAAKHSGVRHFEVRSWATPNEVHLMVGDSGGGFDTAAVKAGPGLGLISMEERLKLLKGTLSVESRLHCGTTIHARVPFRSDSNPAPTEGRGL
jgi:PAS domain S-box-containing protein